MDWLTENAWLGWLGVALVLAAIEAATVDFVFVMLAGGALAAAIAAALGAPFIFQVVIGVAAAVALPPRRAPHRSRTSSWTPSRPSHRCLEPGRARGLGAAGRHRDRRPGQARRRDLVGPARHRRARPSSPATRCVSSPSTARPPSSRPCPQPPRPPDPRSGAHGKAPSWTASVRSSSSCCSRLFVVVVLVRDGADRPAGSAPASSSGSASTPGPSSGGLNILVPFVDRLRYIIDLREQVVSFPPQPVITEDNLVVSIDTVIYFQVTDPVVGDLRDRQLHPGDRAAHR